MFLLLFLPTTALAQSLCYSPSDCVAPMVCTAKAWDTNVGICVLPEVIEQKGKTEEPPKEQEEPEEPPKEQTKKERPKKKEEATSSAQEASLLPARMALMEKKKTIRDNLEQVIPPSDDDMKQMDTTESTHTVAPTSPTETENTNESDEDVSLWKKTENFFVSTIDTIILKPAGTVWDFMKKTSLKVLGE